VKEVYDYLIKDLGLKIGDTVVVGVSGGPDSMALLHILKEVKKETDIYIVCAHVNHNVRKESEEEKTFLEKYCDNNQIYFESMKIEEYGDDNFHNEARSKRYAYFTKIVKKFGARYLFTAHHADDLIETILMRISRGSSLKGYGGFLKRIDMGAYEIIRPFITITKDEILEYNRENKVKYVEDASNKKDKYTRNRYRKYVLPFLKSEDPNIHEKFIKFSQTLLECNDYVDRQMNKVINSVFNQNILNIEKYLEQDKIIQHRIINYILECIYQDDLMLISDVHSELIYKLIKSTKASSCIHLPNNVKVVKSYNSITFANEKSDDYEIELSDYINLSNGMNLEIVDSSDSNSNFVCRLNSKELKLPLYVRNRKLGDKIDIKGTLGSKKLKDIFIDEKIPIDQRETWPVVLDSSDKIVFLPGLKKSKYDKEKSEKYDIIIKYY
jgi:tRNA(Ile)-lysidine synthase